jgi:hypothetical protein
MIEVYLDSSIPPSIQIDISHELHQKLYKAASKISQGSHSLHEMGVFEEAKSHFFKELVPYWAGYKFKAKEAAKNGTVPMTKEEKILRARLEEFLIWKNPSPNMFKLPLLSPRSKSVTPILSNQKQNQHQQILAQQTLITQTNQTHNHHHPHHHQTNMNIVFSIATGIKFKDDRSLGTGAQAATAAASEKPPQTSNNNGRRMSRVSRNSSALLQNNSNSKITA